MYLQTEIGGSLVDSIHVAALSHSLSEMIDLVKLHLTQAREHLIALCR